MNAEDTPTNPPQDDGPQAPAGGPEAPASEPKIPVAGPRRITRSNQDRVIGGVCGGLGRYFNTDPIIFRIGAIALTFVGGAGLLLYLAALLLVPGEEAGASTAAGITDGRSRALTIVGVVVILVIASPFLLGLGFVAAGLVIPLAILLGAGVLTWWLVSGEGPSGEPKDIARRSALGAGVLILCGVVALGGAVAAAAGPDWVVATVVIVAGAAIVAGSFLKPVRWLVLPAVTLALAAGTVSAAGIDLDGGVGEREYRPASASDLQERYELGLGELVIDLRDADLPAGDVPLELDLGMGEARLLVPEDVCVAATADLGAGEVRFFDRGQEGIDLDFSERPDAEGDSTRILLDAEIGVGELRVAHEDYRSTRGVDFGTGRNQSDFGEAGNFACEATGESAND